MNMVLLIKFWRECIIALLAFLLLIFFMQIHKKDDAIESLKNQHTVYTQKQQQEQLKLQVEAQQKLTQAEHQYSEKLKQISHDADLAHTRADSLSKQLTQANARIKTARREAVEEYSRVQSNVLSSCITEYRNMAKIADEYRADANRR